ncbi:hypothetical protein AAC978_07785 [Desulfitobacterium sp. THU1]
MALDNDEVEVFNNPESRVHLKVKGCEADETCYDVCLGILPVL